MGIELPARVAVRVRAGHALETDPPHALSSVMRWTCGTCGDAVLVCGTNVYGNATERDCPQPQPEPECAWCDESDGFDLGHFTDGDRTEFGHAACAPSGWWLA